MADMHQTYQQAPQYQQQQQTPGYHPQNMQHYPQQQVQQQQYQQEQPQQYHQQQAMQQQPPPQQSQHGQQQAMQQHPPPPQQSQHGQQQAHGHPALTQEWQNSLFDCGPCESCLLGCCLPCVLVGKTSERIRDPSMQTYETFNNDCLLMCGISYLTGCGWIYAMLKRTEIRERYGIKGDDTGDCCTAYWCACCAIIQHDKEVQARTAGQAGLVTQAYQPPQGGMVMPGHQQEQKQQGYAQQPQHVQQHQSYGQSPPPTKN